MESFPHLTPKEFVADVCSRWNIYYPTLAALKPHSAVCSFVPLVEDEDDIDLDQGDIPEHQWNM